MKRIILILMVLVVMSLSCSQVQMTAPYRAQTEATAIRLTELNKRCQAGDSEACKEGLRVATDHVNYIVDAIYGRESE